MSHETKSLMNVVSNLAFSLLIPIYILNSTKLPFTPEVRLVIAVLFPLLFGAFDWWRTRKHNLLALLGLVNVVITGGFGLLQLEGFWFSVKEASFPLLIGTFVWISGWRKEPFFAKMLLSPEVFNTEKLEATLKASQKEADFQNLLIRSNHFLSFSFLISALLNFIIAEQTFTPLSESLDAISKANALNEQIALMHKRGFLGIAIPSMVMLLGLLLYYFKQLEKITGESIESFMHQPPPKKTKSGDSLPPSP